MYIPHVLGLPLLRHVLMNYYIATKKEKRKDTQNATITIRKHISSFELMMKRLCLDEIP